MASRYDYMGPAGDVVERVYPLGKAPQSVRIGGVKYRKVPCLPASMHIADNVAGRRLDFVGHSLDPAHHKFHQGEFTKDANGQSVPVFSGARQRDAFLARAADAGVQLRYEAIDRCPSFKRVDRSAGRKRARR